jgi:hypothetical protein
VVAMLRLQELGWSATRLSKEFGGASNTVRRYLREGGAAPSKRAGSPQWFRWAWMIGSANASSGMTAMPMDPAGVGQRAWNYHRFALGRASGAGMAALTQSSEAGNSPVQARQAVDYRSTTGRRVSGLATTDSD